MRRGEAAKIEPCILQNTKWSKTGQEACKFKEKNPLHQQNEKGVGKGIYSNQCLAWRGQRSSLKWKGNRLNQNVPYLLASEKNFPNGVPVELENKEESNLKVPFWLFKLPRRSLDAFFPTLCFMIYSFYWRKLDLKLITTVLQFPGKYFVSKQKIWY